MVKLPFRDRLEAGCLLGTELAAHKLEFRENTIVLGLPRAGIVIGSAVADILRVPLDVVVVRKFGVPGQPELAMGAIAGTRVRVLDKELIKECCVSDADVETAALKEMEEAKEIKRFYRNDRPAPDLHGWTVILVDDGMATGTAMIAATEYVNSFQPAEVIVAVPVASVGACNRLRPLATELVCLATPEPFDSVGKWYGDFRQVSDEEVRRVLERNYRRIGPPVRTIHLTPELARTL